MLSREGSHGGKEASSVKDVVDASYHGGKEASSVADAVDTSCQRET